MSDDFTFSVSGTRVILDNLDKLEVEVLAKVQAAMEVAAQVGEEVMKANARVRTGEMRNSTYAEVRDDQIVFGDDAPWAIFNELGFHHYGSGTWVAPQPFIVPGALAGGDALKEQLERGLII